METRPPQSQPDSRSAVIDILGNAFCKVGDLNCLLALKQLRRQAKPVSGVKVLCFFFSPPFHFILFFSFSFGHIGVAAN